MLIRWSWVNLVLLCFGTALAQDRIREPMLTSMHPSGVQVGQPAEITFHGTNLDEPIGLKATFPVQWEILPGGSPMQLRVRVTALQGAWLGWHLIHVVTKKGVSNGRLFCVDELPQVLTAGTPHSPEHAQAIAPPCVVCGILEKDKSHWFKLSVRAGQRLSFEVLGRRLGSRFDPQLALYDGSGRRQLAFSDDAPGQQKDPRLQWVFPDAGEVLVELRDVRYQGGTEWGYRLRVGDFPLVNSPYPLAIQKGKTAELHFVGPQGTLATPVVVDTAELLKQNGHSLPAFVPVSPRGPTHLPNHPFGLPAWPVPVFLSAHPELVDAGTNDSLSSAQELPVPGGISGRFPQPASKRFYRFQGKKDQKYLLTVVSHAIGLPTTVLLTVLDNQGRTLAASNPTDDPVRILFTAPADGIFIVQAEHLFDAGGVSEAFRLEIKPAEPDFLLEVATDRVNLPTGHGAALLVTARREQYEGAIEIVAAEGNLVVGTIPAGQVRTFCWLPATLAVAPRLQLKGRAVAAAEGPLAEPRFVQCRQVLRQTHHQLRYWPLHLGYDLAVQQTPAPPFTLAARYVHPSAVRGLPVPVAVTVTRPGGVPEELTLSAETWPVPPGQPPLVAPLRTKIPADRAEATIELLPAPQAPSGLEVVLTATNAAGQSLSVLLPPLRFGPPFELTVAAPSPLSRAGRAPAPPPKADLLLWPGWVPGLLMCPAAWLDEAFWLRWLGLQPVRIQVERQGGYRGPIILEVLNLPPGVTADKVSIPEGANTAWVVLRSGSATPPVRKADVYFQGTATGAGNQQHRSAPFTVVVSGDDH
jgi:hypothetical protein